MKEETKNKLNDFIRFAKSDETFFTLPYGKYTKTVFFSVSANGQKAIYAGESSDCPFKVGESLGLMAIVKDPEIYIFDYITFRNVIDCISEEPLEGVTVVDYRYMNNIKSQMSEALLDLYSDLQENTSLSDPNWLYYASEAARKNLLQGFDLDEAEKKAVLEKSLTISTQDVVNTLSGIKSLKSLVHDKFLEDEEYFKNLKAAYKHIKAMCENGTADVEDYELQIAAALKDLKAVNVMVTFTVNGKSAEIKVSLDTLKRKLLARDYFSYYSFSPEKAGRALIDHLGIDPYGGLLRCDKISKITYGKKTLFEKGEES